MPIQVHIANLTGLFETLLWLPPHTLLYAYPYFDNAGCMSLRGRRGGLMWRRRPVTGTLFNIKATRFCRRIFAAAIECNSYNRGSEDKN